MISTAELARALYGAYRLARFDAHGLRQFNATVEGFWHSFWAAPLIAPAYALLLLLRFDAGMGEVHPMRFVLMESVAYVLAWVAFPVIMVAVTQWLQCFDRFVGYIVAYNWAAVIQNVLYMPLAMLTVSGVLPSDVGNLLGLVVLVYVLVYGGFIARSALGVPAATAAAIVTLDLVVGLLINGLAEGRT